MAKMRKNGENRKTPRKWYNYPTKGVETVRGAPCTHTIETP